MAARAGWISIQDEQRERVAQALQSLLTRVYRLSVHRETKDTPGYELLVTKDGLRYDHLQVFAAPDQNFLSPSAPTQPLGIDGWNASDGGRILLERVDMPTFARFLSSYLHQVVVDETGLRDLYSFHLDWDKDADASSRDLAGAVQEQLGLALREHKQPMDILAIDSVEQPSEN